MHTNAYMCKYKLGIIIIIIDLRWLKMNNVIITLRTNEEIKKELDKIVLEENRSLNNLVVTIFVKYLDERNKKDGNKNGK